MNSATNPIISLSHLSKSFGQRSVIRDLNLTLEQGQCVGLLGPNGAGKSTTIKMLLGHLRPDGGTMTIFGEPVSAHPEKLRQRIGVVAQFDSLDPDFTVEENLLVYARYFGLKPETLSARIDHLLDFSMLSTRAKDPISALSGGMKRRLSIARALVHSPSLIFLDEPTTGLDPQARHLLWSRLQELKKQGLSILLTTHFMDEAERLCDVVAILDQGEIKAQGTPQTLIDHHINAEVVEIYGEGLDQFQSQLIQKIGAESSVPTFGINHTERAGETLFCYVREPKALITLVHQHDHLRFIHRPANLEDVFLRLTGRDLRE